MYRVGKIKVGYLTAYRKFKTLSAVKKSIETGWFKAEVGDHFRVIKSMKQANDLFVPVYMWDGERLVKL
mgnify:CR=1 FL=1|tara:strand:- start:147 stop:353 length:207 start_codon:yes stop_codon:yes gene_type:complete